MAHVNVSTEIPASPENVWKVLSDLSGWEQWMTIHDKFYGDAPTDVAVGTKFSEQCTIMGMSNKIDWVIEALDAPSSMTISGKGLAGAQITFSFSVEGTGDSSTATIDADFTGQMVVGAIGAAIERASAKECQASLEKLAGLVG